METFKVSVDTTAFLPASVLTPLPGAFTTTTSAVLAAMMVIESETRPSRIPDSYPLVVGPSRWTSSLDLEVLEIAGSFDGANGIDGSSANLFRTKYEPYEFHPYELLHTIQRTLLTVRGLRYSNPFELVLQILASAPAMMAGAWSLAKLLEAVLRAYRELMASDSAMHPHLAFKVSEARLADELDRLEGESERRRTADRMARAEAMEKELQVQALRQSMAAERPMWPDVEKIAKGALEVALHEAYPEEQELANHTAATLAHDPSVSNAVFDAGRWADAVVEPTGSPGEGSDKG